MASKVVTYKRLLTTNCNKLDRIISAYKEDKLHEIPLDPSASQELHLDNVQRLQEAISAIEIVTNKLEKTLFEFASTMDDEALHQGKEAEEFETYSIRVDTALSGAFDFAVILQAKLRVLTSTPRDSSPHGTVSTPPGNQPRTKAIELPPVPIPIFEGNIWEWDNFWGIFQTNIHSQDIPEMIKFNYLLNSLKGEARESIKKFQVTANNYSRAINFLLNKYNNREALVNNLIERLDSCVLRTPSIKDQRALLENLQAIVIQLQEKQEDVNSSWLIKKVLTKFPDSTKRKVLSKRQGQAAETAFTMQNLFKLVEEVLTNEELILQFTDKKSPSPGFFSFSSKKPRFTGPWKKNCMYCGNDHSSSSCTKYVTAQDRSEYLRQNRLCLICASSQHKTAQCKGRPCLKCEGAHHSSCCFSAKGKTAPQRHNSDSKKREGKEIMRSISKTTGQRGGGSEPKIRSNVVTSEMSPDTAQPVLHAHLSGRSCLPTGEVTVLDPRSKALIKVDVLIDTGAELSFVDESLARKLGLPVLRERKIRINTFGTKEVKEKQCELVRLDLWDDEGTPHSLELLTYKTLTQPFQPPQLSVQDQEYLQSLDLTISPKTRATINPMILLGCDLLWSFIRTDIPTARLPSGLNVMPSKLGALISGKSNVQPVMVAQMPQHPQDDIDLWDSIWSMNTVQSICLTSANNSEISQEERDEWEKYWAMDATGAEEFQEAQQTAQEALDKKVWDHFNSTIERREDGYYVRLPWKEQHPILPDNKALAYRRLNSVWTYLKRDEDLLDQYHNIFQEQLVKNIVEVVDENEAGEQFQVHYIPHQPVLTPHKTTTKLRIVFDASAHYKGCPSLNDVLHRGPVILPRLHGLLLRFRIGAIALTADVEKAFLQVRLHEADRNATRCLWLQDHKKPPTADNLQTLRFTRVAFGLKSSPFLLAGTTHYHLDGYPQEPLAQEIKNNLYVDNLLLTTDTIDDSIQCYWKSKRIFEDLNMNLREFTSNSEEVMKAIKEPDKAISPSPKVLGIQWNKTTDVLTLSCSIPDICPITKRTITSAIATIYDPMGWYVPLLHRARVFLQNLWKEQYDWNTPLSAAKADEWRQIRTQFDGFHKTLPRFLTQKRSTVVLAAFSDASSSGMAACTYLCQDTVANLLMARSKLPAIHGKTTIPKLELNAITLAMRLTNFVMTHLDSVLCIQEVYLLCDSEIVLGWLKSKPSREVGVFVRNRLTEIRQIATSLIEKGHFVKFGYVASEENPADCGSRGLTKEELLEHCWWTGPQWINEIGSSSWSLRFRVFSLPEDEDGDDPVKNESRRIFATIASKVAPYDPELIQHGHVHTFTKAKRIVAYALRFLRAIIARCRSRNKNTIVLSEIPDAPPRTYSSFLCASEMESAGKIIIKAHQRLRVTKVIIDSLKNLNIHQDENGILRCYGRLGRAQLDFNAKYPILVLQKTLLAQIIIQECHEQGHPGINHTISLVRQEFWIPQLRAQVQRIVRKCIRCQKFNNLPYKYPAQDDLPKERVVRSRPFQHVGLDYFGPLTVIREEGKEGKCYGSIITCMVTRLLHLDIVSDLSTVAFLHMLRRFFARRGVPETITSDNAPTFLLGEAILQDGFRALQEDPALAGVLSSRGIEWRHITPYAPWQGGFYERLIKSIKQSLYKTLGQSVVSFEEMLTLVVEIESMLNTRPLTYATTDLDNTVALRPIDFLQRDLNVSFPLLTRKDQDLDYIPPEEMPAIQTKQQAIAALESSCKLTEKFWQVWQNQYLTELREKHILNVGHKRGSSQPPREGALVLICEAVLPRHLWRTGIIQELVTNTKGTTREAVVRLPSRRLIRRPINLLVPLELDDCPNNDTKTKSEDQEKVKTRRPPEKSTNETLLTDQDQESSRTQNRRYNFRKRPRLNYDECDHSPSPIFRLSGLSLFSVIQIIIQIVLILTPKVSSLGAAQDTSYSKRFIQCVQGGVHLYSAERVPYEICAEQYCVHFDKPRISENVSFPPEIIVHEHRVLWKFFEGESVNTIETLCPAASFCQSLDCTFCSANIFNPECWPTRAILGTMAIIYFLITGCYVFLYVPLVVGRPLRILMHLGWKLLKFVVRKMKSLGSSRTNRATTRRRNLAEIIAILCSLFQILSGCQMVDIFNHYSTVCTDHTSGPCQIRLSEVLKINAFKREACLRLSNNKTPIHEVRLKWNSVDLRCEAETELFTRDTTHKIVDSKRCATQGMCKDDKCGSVTSSSKITDLEPGNGFPGNTFCAESCGGLGCGCFLPSSGCLFYRIYLVPINDVVYEIFRCNRWAETAKIAITHVDKIRDKTSVTTTKMMPNIPKKWNSLSLTLSSLSLPPLPLLNTRFITDSKHIAIWGPSANPALQCSNFSSAQDLQCQVFEDCTCQPAETKANCRCRDFPIGLWFNTLRHRLPLTFPSLTFLQEEKTVIARVSNMVMSEFVMTFEDVFEPSILVDDAICKIEDADIRGCYNCAKGAFASVKCTSSRDNMVAEVICGQNGFSIPCNSSGSESTLRFSFSQAQVQLTCSVSCGKVSSTGNIQGILKFTGSVTGMLEQWLTGTPATSIDISWPDFYHIATVFLQYYKTLLAAVLGLMIILGLTYLILSTCGLRIAMWICLLGPRIVIASVEFLCRCLQDSKKKIGHKKQH